ncbi:EamA-like transporter family protein [Paracoccus halophilus]|uniref:EamA-like transporter family protein n=1 Tax=Paracoccus halophilus TaxID=376733 RepID=A0A099F718_9RHOB|nr:DMT family transporter [Paracoccus halophilus]KGJ06495.1 membrane protein [Paracoccus halophilus]SFA37971.1 EamA-like transporter family protein [Paracoccus halophilus]
MAGIAARAERPAPIPHTRRESLRGHVAMLVFSVLIAGSFSLGARVANLIDPVAITAIRFVLASIVVALYAVLAGPGLPRHAFAAPWRYLILGGLYAAYFVLMFEGLKTALPVSTAAVFALTPLMTAGFSWLLLRQIAGARMATALVLGGLGCLWVIFRGDLAAMARLDFGRGEAIYLLGCAAHALYTPMVRRLNRGERPVVFTFGTLVAGTLVLLIWGWGAIRATDWMELPALVWITLFYVAVFATAATVVLVQFAALRLPAAKVMAYTYLTPVWVIALEGLLTGALPGLIVLPGITAIMLALLLLLKD